MSALHLRDRQENAQQQSEIDRDDWDICERYATLWGERLFWPASMIHEFTVIQYRMIRAQRVRCYVDTDDIPY